MAVWGLGNKLPEAEGGGVVVVKALTEPVRRRRGRSTRLLLGRTASDTRR